MKRLAPELPHGHVSILDRAFVWRDSASTDVGATFARVRERMTQERQNEQERQIKVKPMVRPKEQRS